MMRTNPLTDVNFEVNFYLNLLFALIDMAWKEEYKAENTVGPIVVAWLWTPIGLHSVWHLTLWHCQLSMGGEKQKRSRNTLMYQLSDWTDAGDKWKVLNKATEESFCSKIGNTFPFLTPDNLFVKRKDSFFSKILIFFFFKSLSNEMQREGKVSEFEHFCDWWKSFNIAKRRLRLGKKTSFKQSSHFQSFDKCEQLHSPWMGEDKRDMFLNWRPGKMSSRGCLCAFAVLCSLLCEANN